MAQNVSLKIMKCPTCGASLKAKNDTEAITCVYCGNTIVPVTDAAPVPQQENAGGFSGVLKVEGIKTSSSALAYIELFFEEYDWDAFAYAQTLSISEIDKLANSLKVSSADDKSTWLACFKAASVPFANKIAGCRKILASVIEEYKKDNLDAYSKFDAYKRIAAMIYARKPEIVANLEKIADKAAKYGASATEMDGLRAEIESISTLSGIAVYDHIESIPEIENFICEKNARIVAQLAAAGINAEEEYCKAKTLIDEKQYVAALNVLLSLKGYSDSKLLIEKLDKYFLISDVLEVEGNLYYFKNDESEYQTISLYPAVNGKISDKAIIKHISKIITNHADIIYYLDRTNRIRQFNLSTKVETKLFDKTLDKNSLFVYGRKVFMLTNNGGDSSIKRNIVVLDLIAGTVNTILENAKSIQSLTGNKLVFTATKKVKEDERTVSSGVCTYVINVDTLSLVEIGSQKLTIEGFVGNSVVYTQVAPNNFNRSLYIKPLQADEPEQLIEQNIYQFCGIIAGKLFYYIGNSRNQTLININCDGTERKEWPLYISDVLFEQGGWLYFIRKAGYNAILCKSRLDGSRFSIIAADIDKFIDIKNGYLYYINDSSRLVKVRMDGSNMQTLCEDVETVLSVQEDKIIFISIDDKITSHVFEQATVKTVKSIYAVDFSGSGKIKLAYNIKTAQEYDEDTVYYIAASEVKATDELPGNIDTLYKLDVETNYVEKLLDIKVVQEETKSPGFTVAMIIMAIAFFFAFIGMVSNTPGIGALGFIVGFISLIIGCCIKAKEKAE